LFLHVVRIFMVVSCKETDGKEIDPHARRGTNAPRGLGFVKFRQIESVHASAFQPPPEAVTSVVAQRGQWPVSMTAIGTMESCPRLMSALNLPGTVARINFDSAKVCAKGIFSSSLIPAGAAQLASLEAQSELARQPSADEGTGQCGVISRSEYDQATSQQKATEANDGGDPGYDCAGRQFAHSFSGSILASAR